MYILFRSHLSANLQFFYPSYSFSLFYRKLTMQADQKNLWILMIQVSFIY